MVKNTCIKIKNLDNIKSQVIMNCIMNRKYQNYVIHFAMSGFSNYSYY